MTCPNCGESMSVFEENDYEIIYVCYPCDIWGKRDK